MEERRILVAGCGYVGSALAARLAADGHRVHGLRRDVSGLPKGVLPVTADLTRLETLRAIPADIEQVVYAASASGRTPEAYEDAYVRGLSNLLDHLAGSTTLTRALFTSSTAVYGQDDGGWVDEESPTEPTSFSGEILLKTEALLASAPMESASLRLAGIYGPGRTWLVRSVEEGTARADSPGAERYGNRVHRDDCAGALRHLLSLDALEPVYLGVDDAPVPLAEVYSFVAELLAVSGPATGGASRGRGGNKRCSNARLKASGYEFASPTYREGYPPIVSAYLADRA